MFGFSKADLLFIVLVMLTIFACVGISDMRRGNRKENPDGGDK